MKYCVKCGNEIMDEAVVCVKCGCAVNQQYQKKNGEVSGMKTAVKILLIVSCVLLGCWIIPLCWTVPMTVSYCNKIKRNEPVSTAFKICTLLFVNLIAGILMLCDNDN